MDAGTIRQQEALRALLGQLIQDGKQQEAAELSVLFAQFSAMERQYGKILCELSAVREQLAALHGGEQKTAIMQDTTKMQAHLSKAKENLAALKDDVMGRIRKTAAAVKQHGISALDKAMDLFGVKKALAEMEGNVRDAIKSAQAGIDRINAIGGELHALGGHARNLGRALMGKETEGLAQRDGDRGVLAAIAKHLKRHKAVLEGVKKSLGRAMERVARLEQAAAGGREKPSIREEIRAAEKPGQPEKKAPQKVQEACL